MRTEHIFVIGAAKELRAQFFANKTGFSTPPLHHPTPYTAPTLHLSRFPTDRSNAVLLLQFFFCLYVCGFICSVCAVLICSSFLLVLVPWENRVAFPGYFYLYFCSYTSIVVTPLYGFPLCFLFMPPSLKNFGAAYCFWIVRASVRYMFWCTA